MKTFACIASLATGLIALPAIAQPGPERPTIVVEGRGVAERAPDAFFIGGDLRGEGPDSVSALRALAAAQTRVTEGLNDFEGLSAGKLRTETVEVQPVYADNCAPNRRDDNACPVAAYAATMRFQFKGAPARLAGDAVSLAAELGARRVSITGAEVEDETALYAEANRLAFADARRQADTLAEASGQRIVRLLRVQDSDAQFPDYNSGALDEVVVTGSRIRPSVAIPVDQPPVEIERRLTVVFEIE